MVGYIILGVVVVLILLIVVYLISTNNKLVRLRNTALTAFSTMDVYLKQRWDLVPNLVSTVKGYAKHEEGVLKEIVELRNSAADYSKLSTDEKLDLNNKLAQKMHGLLALVENYPDLKASSNFTNLSNSLSSIEKDIANARKYYNGCVNQLNTTIQVFPSNLVAKMFHFETMKLFEIAETERQNVKVEF